MQTVDGWRRDRIGQSLALVANAADVLPELVRRGWHPDLVTDQTSAHDPLNGYVPNGLTLTDALALRASDPDDYVRRAKASMAEHVRAMLAFQRGGSVDVRLRQQHPRLRAGGRRRERLRLPRLRARLHPPALQRRARAPSGSRRCPARWRTSRASTARSPSSFLDDDGLQRWLRLAAEKVPVQGLPARICWLGYGDRARAGLAINDLVASGEVAAPIVIGRDHLDAGSVASPYRETEAMRDGSDAIADWPILNALVNTAAGATWVSFHHGGGVGIGYSLHAGMVVVADGTPEAAARLERVLTSDPGMGVLRHADAGYERALEVADERGLRIPMRPDA